VSLLPQKRSCFAPEGRKIENDKPNPVRVRSERKVFRAASPKALLKLTCLRGREVVFMRFWVNSRLIIKALGAFWIKLI